MAELTAQEVLTQIYKRLVEPEFAASFTAVSDDGSRAILVAERSDTLVSLERKVVDLGGRVSVVVALLNGLLVFQMSSDDDLDPDHASTPVLNAECTVGLLIGRFIADGGLQRSYRVESARLHEGAPESAHVDGAALLV